MAESRAARLDRSTMQLDETFREREPDPQAAFVAIERRTNLLKHLKDRRQRFGIEPDTVVRNSQLDRRAVAVCMQTDLAVRVRVLRGVREQVADHLREAQRIGIERDPLARA